MENSNTTLTDEQIDQIGQDIDDFVKGTDLEKISQFPSNQGVETTDPENRESGEIKKMNVAIDPNTGEHKIIGVADDKGLEDEETFEEMCARIEAQDIEVSNTPITENEILEYLSSDNADSMIKEISKDSELSADAIKTLLDMVNRKMNKEEFNVFKSFPEEVQAMVNNYINTCGIQPNSTEGKTFRNLVSEQLLSEFITNITIDRTMTDFNKEIETLFEKGASEISDTIVGYTEERNQKYREYADTLDDEEKKEKISNVLDRIEEAHNITELKEFSKKCKIKKFELEKPGKVFSGFLHKYANSTYNIYDINMAAPILYRNINKGEEQFTDKDINAFLVCFCKQVMNKSPENVYDHAYMYYFIYNLVLLDINKGDKKEVSDDFLNNIKECIYNLRARNNNFK